MQNLWPEIERQAAHFSTTAAAKKVALVGAGFYGRAAYHCLQGQGVDVVCFADNDPKKQATAQGGVDVVPLEALSERGAPLALITSPHAILPLARQLDALGITHLSFDGFFLRRHLQRLQNVRDQLADERSLQVFDSIVLARFSGDMGYCQAVAEDNQYFALPEFTAPGPTHYVDAGAYVGDSVERFLWAHNGVFRKIHAFEPGQKQFAALTRRMERLAGEWAFEKAAYHCVRAGLGDSETQKSFTSADHSSVFNEDDKGERVSITTLDQYLSGEPVTLIKADIEGMEFALLKGAAQSIRRHKPKLAINLYHKPDDLFAIPEYIKSLVPEYRMAVRHHSPLLLETVLYCWTENA